MNDRIPPLAEADLWQAVMAAAADRCQCRGTCGKSHKADGGRCPRQHCGLAHKHGGGTVHLLAAPAEPADMLLPPHRAAALPKQSLAAWCKPCHDDSRTAARKTCHTAPVTAPDSLF